MRTVSLNIADYIIKLIAADGAPAIVPGRRFMRNITGSEQYDIAITIHNGMPQLPADMTRVFHAPFYLETEKGMEMRDENLWSVYTHSDRLVLKTWFPQRGTEKGYIRGCLLFSLEGREWDLHLEGELKEFDPLEYPLDGLVLYYLTAIHGDLFIHGSSVIINNRGYLFTGVSGSGKSTLAGLMEEHGARVIHDDRVIVRERDDRSYMMHNTPVYDDDEPRSGVLRKIFLISHGKSNSITPLGGATAMARLMSNCIQHNWSPSLIGRLTGTLQMLTIRVPVALYSFLPDSSAAEHILLNDETTTQ
jgi:hypothetical protein